jgi:peptide chain release factor subunit 1
VAVITEDAIRRLAGFKGVESPVVTCYLDVDGRRLVRRQDVERELDALLRQARSRAGDDRRVLTDLARIEEHVRRGIDRSHTRGIAFFACGAHGLWEVFTLPVPVRSQVVVNSMPAVGQLERLVREYEKFGVLLADRQRSRVFVFEMGELVEHDEVVDELPRDWDERGHLERGEPTSHVEALAERHLRHAAARAFAVWQATGFAHLAIGASDEIASELEALLHPYLRSRLTDRVPVGVGASLTEVRAAAAEVEQRHERRRERELVERLRQAVGTGRRGTAGLAPVLEALVQRRVDHLLVSAGYAAPGWRCPSCDHLATRGRTCPMCGTEMGRVPDVVEEAVEEALAQSCRVDFCVACADLDVMGRIGALLRY